MNEMKWRFRDVMSCDFQSKMAERLSDHRSLNIEANCKQKVPKGGKLNYLQDGLSGV